MVSHLNPSIYELLLTLLLIQCHLCDLAHSCFHCVLQHVSLVSVCFKYEKGRKRDLSRERESSEQFVWHGERETQLRRWAMMPSIQADWSQDEVI